jgi:uncharacterized membrane protein
VRLRRLMIALAVVGLCVAAYLTVVHYVGFSVLACSGGHGGHSSCQTVQSSEWSKLAGVPVALIGLIGYIGILGSLLAPDREETRLITLGMTVIGFGFSAYLTYREAASIHAYCEWCLSSAGIMTILFLCAVARYLIGGPSARPAPESALTEAELSPG